MAFYLEYPNRKLPPGVPPTHRQDPPSLASTIEDFATNVSQSALSPTNACGSYDNNSRRRSHSNVDMDRGGGCASGKRIAGILLPYRTVNERNKTRRVKWPDMEQDAEQQPLAKPDERAKGCIQQHVEEIIDTVTEGSGCCKRDLEVSSDSPTIRTLETVHGNDSLRYVTGGLSIQTDLPLEEGAPCPDDPILSFREKKHLRTQLPTSPNGYSVEDDFLVDEDDVNSIVDDGDDWAPRPSRQERTMLETDPVLHARLNPTPTTSPREDPWAAETFPAAPPGYYTNHVEEDWSQQEEEDPRRTEHDPYMTRQQDWGEEDSRQYAYESYRTREQETRMAPPSGRSSTKRREDIARRPERKRDTQNTSRRKPKSKKGGLLSWRKSNTKNERSSKVDKESHYAEINWKDEPPSYAAKKPAARPPAVDQTHVGEIHWKTHEGKKVGKLKHVRKQPWQQRTVKDLKPSKELEEWEQEIKQAISRSEALDLMGANDESSDSDIGDRYNRAQRRRDPQGRQRNEYLI